MGAAVAYKGMKSASDYMFPIPQIILEIAFIRLTFQRSEMQDRAHKRNNQGTVQEKFFYPWETLLVLISYILYQ